MSFTYFYLLLFVLFLYFATKNTSEKYDSIYNHQVYNKYIDINPIDEFDYKLSRNKEYSLENPYGVGSSFLGNEQIPTTMSDFLFRINSF